MRKITLLFVLTFVVFALSAQTDRTFATHNPIRSEQYLFGEKSPSYRLVSRQSTDDFEQINFYYDGRGRIEAIQTLCTTDDPVIDSIVYNENNQVIQINGWQNIQSAQWKHVYIVNFEYDAQGRRIRRTNFNSLGTETMTQGGVFDYSYNAAGNLIAHEGYLGNYQTLYETAEYEYDAQNRLIRKYTMQGYGTVDSSILDTYTYNEAGLLAESRLYYYGAPGWDLFEVEQFEYDAQGNCTDHSTMDEYGDYKDRRFYHYNLNVPSQNVVMPYYVPELTFPEAFNDANQRTLEEWWTIDDESVLQYVCDFEYVYDNIPESIQDATATELTVYPNPASDVLNVEMAQNATLFIFNAEGRLLQSSTMSEGAHSLNVGAFAPGVYFMNVRYQDGSMARSKFVKE